MVGVKEGGGGADNAADLAVTTVHCRSHATSRSYISYQISKQFSRICQEYQIAFFLQKYNIPGIEIIFQRPEFYKLCIFLGKGDPTVYQS